MGKVIKSKGKSDNLRDKNRLRHSKYHKGGGKSGASTNPDRVRPDGTKGKEQSHYRSKSTINLLNMYKQKVDKEKYYEKPQGAARIQPDRKWFGNVRTIDQKSLEKFRSEMAQQQKNPFEFLIKKKQLPTSLLVDPSKENKLNILEMETFQDTFGPKQKRKRPKIETGSYEELTQIADSKLTQYTTDYTKDKDRYKQEAALERVYAKDKRLEAGSSKRIWEELYKVLDASNVIVQVIDARDPLGTRCKHVEEHLKKNCPTKHMVLVLNKCDLIPTIMTKKWVQYLSKEYPTIAYHASITNPFGKGSLINILRQFDNFHKDAKTISVGFIGYPNVGKSSIINSLKAKAVCRAAPVPGETKIWQYVHLTKRIYLIDCPGVVYNFDGKDEYQVVLKGVVRAEKLTDPTVYIYAMLKECKAQDLERIYGVKDWTDYEDFLKLVALKKGRLIKGGEPDLVTTAKLILFDWQKGDIPYYKYPPNFKLKENKQQKKETKKDIPEQPQQQNVEKQEIQQEEVEEYDESVLNEDVQLDDKDIEQINKKYNDIQEKFDEDVKYVSDEEGDDEEEIKEKKQNLSKKIEENLDDEDLDEEDDGESLNGKEKEDEIKLQQQQQQNNGKKKKESKINEKRKNNFGISQNFNKISKNKKRVKK